MSAGQPAETLSPRDKAALDRNGACVVKSCTCEYFAFVKLMDGFRMCECKHTQIGHRAS